MQKQVTSQPESAEQQSQCGDGKKVNQILAIAQAASDLGVSSVPKKKRKAKPRPQMGDNH